MLSPDELYFDHNATSPLLPEVVQALREAMERGLANPASPHRAGLRSRARLRRAREQVAGLLRIEPRELLFTSGASEANQLAIEGLVPTSAPGHVVASAIEHSSVLAACERLRDRGHQVSLVRPDPNGVVAAESIETELREDTRLVVVMASNNETGVIQPVPEVAAMLAPRGIPFHVDAVQSLGRDMERIPDGVTTVSVSAHKIGGPAGVGALWLRPGQGLRPLLAGGTQERGLRGGTHNLLGVIGFGAAAEFVTGRSAWSPDARDHFESAILSGLEGVQVNGSDAQRLPNTSNLQFDDVDGQVLLGRLSDRGVQAAQGSACQAGASEPSHVLKAMGLSLRQVRSSLRFSFAHGASRADVEEGARRLVAEVQELRSGANGA